MIHEIAVGADGLRDPFVNTVRVDIVNSSITGTIPIDGMVVVKSGTRFA